MADLVRLAILENEFEAQIMADFLERDKIPHVIRSYHDTAYNGLFQGQIGWGAVFAPDEYKTVITEYLKEIRKELDKK
ncbi:MAG: hypothetical protein H6Q75_1633 [Firmicutes bacterium]|nr:hypothetical protein [Bacillota bacterium]